MLLSADAAMLARLPAALRAEANVLRGRAARTGQLRRAAAPQGAPHFRSSGGTSSNEGIVVAGGAANLAEMITSEISDLLPMYHKAEAVKDAIIRLFLCHDASADGENAVRCLSRTLSLHHGCYAPKTFQCAIAVVDRLWLPCNCNVIREELATVAEQIVSRLRHQFRQGADMDAQLVSFVHHPLFVKCSLLAMPTVDASLQSLWFTLNRRLCRNSKLESVRR